MCVSEKMQRQAFIALASFGVAASAYAVLQSVPADNKYSVCHRLGKQNSVNLNTAFLLGPIGKDC